VPVAADMVAARYHSRMTQLFTNKCFAQKFAQHRTYMAGGVIDAIHHDQKATDDSKITYVLADFMLTRGTEMIDSAVAGLSLDLLEMNERRGKHLLDHLRSWYDSGVASRIVKRYMGASAESYNHLVLWGLLEVITDELDQTVMSVIKDMK